MTKISYLIIFPLLLFSGLKLRAQQVLTLEEAVRIALQNNYNIRLSKNTAEISANNVNIAAAGMLPSVSGNLNNTSSIQNTRQTQADGSVREVDRANNWNTTYGVGLNWTIFDGFAMFANYDELKELRKLDDTNMRATIQNTVSDVVNNYYNLIRLQQQLEATDSAVAISRLRLTTAQNRYQIGKAAKLEVLTATVDLNTDTTNLLRQRDAVRSAKVVLNELLARDVSTNFVVGDSIPVDTKLQYESLLDLSSRQNPSIQAAFINERIARLNLKQVKAARYPVIGVSSGYNFTRSHSELGFARDARGQGFSYGLTASVNIFNGFLQKRNEKNAEIRIDNAHLSFEQLKQNINAQLLTAFQTYQTNMELVKLEERNVGVARQNMDITLAKFRLGSVTPVEFREAQRNYIDANVRYTDAQYQAKTAEIALKELAGNLDL
ncbi:TolC family protein [Pararcticibacter amylolyticus]|uniref:Transporter n=1 Tax=Pararcticibacter amylolyticus TaxID=2173175 RepID=A0A2U2PI16_9SPHI|nr:TolC family protein [Pararcticibacter amylolyticus]PWG81020.1 transporter [Pararcticibacter amylolyticus]